MFPLTCVACARCGSSGREAPERSYLQRQQLTELVAVLHSPSPTPPHMLSHCASVEQLRAGSCAHVVPDEKTQLNVKLPHTTRSANAEQLAPLQLWDTPL